MSVAAPSMPHSASGHGLASLSSHRSDASANRASSPPHLRTASSLVLPHAHDDPHSHYPTSADAYDVYDEIGVGAFSTVYHAVIRETGEDVAIKVIDLDQFAASWEEIRREIQAMSLCGHRNVVRMLASFVEGQDLWIVMPLMNAGSCAHIMKAIYPTGFKDESLVATILREVLLGLLYFHNDGRLHRDLKAANILVSNEGEVQLSDMGVAATLMENGDRKRMRTTFTGTPCWMAPEVMEHSDAGYDEKADIWSFGITALELAYGRAPYAKYPPMKVMVLTLQEEPPTAEIFKDHSYEFSRHFHSLVEKCLRRDPKKRPTARKLLEHKFFKAAKDARYLVDKIVRRMPQRKLNPSKPLNLVELRHPTVQAGTDGPSGERPVSVGSWVFDKAEFDEMKRQVAEAKKMEDGARQGAVADSYADDSPRAAAAASAAAPGPSSRAAGPPAGLPSSGESSDSDAEGGTGSRPMPDFSAPSAEEEAAMQQLSAASVSLRVAQARSPGEHQEGRFMVSDDADDDETYEHEQQMQHVAHNNEAGADTPAGGDDAQAYPADSQAYPPGSYEGESYGDAVAEPDFHNDEAYEEEEAAGGSPQPPPMHAGETHVGRFAVSDDQDDE